MLANTSEKIHCFADHESISHKSVQLDPQVVVYTRQEQQANTCRHVLALLPKSYMPSKKLKAIWATACITWAGQPP